MPGAIKFLGQVFNHTTPTVQCGTGPNIVENFALGEVKSMASEAGVEGEKILGNYNLSSLLNMNETSIEGMVKKVVRRHSRSRSKLSRI